MNITNLNITSATTLNFEFVSNAPICVLRGHYSNLALDLMRELIGDYGAYEDPNRIDDGRFVLHADIEMDEKNYAVCYIRSADFIGDNRLAVNFKPNSIAFSVDDTREFVDKCNERDKTADAIPCVDDRPIFIYDYFDRLDEAIDITLILDKLSSLGRQVFISVCAGYPCKKMKHSKVQIVETDDIYFGEK